METICKYIDNVLQNPTEEKFRRIRRTNKVFRDRVAGLEGAEEFLLDCGFQVDRQTGRQIGRQSGRQTDRQAERQPGGQAARQADRQEGRLARKSGRQVSQ